MSPEELKAYWAEVVEIVPPQIEYRLFYNEDGEITKCTMIAEEATEQPYIVATKEEYESYFRYTVVEGKLKKIDTDSGYRVQLQKATNGYCVIKDHAGIIIEPNEEYTNIEYYGRRNN